MKRGMLGALILIVMASGRPAETRTEEAKPQLLIRRLGRTVVAVNDRAQYQFQGSASGAVITLKPPLVSARKWSERGTPPIETGVLDWLRNLGAEMTLSAALAQGTAGFNLPVHLDYRIQMALYSTPVEIQTGPTVKAMLTHVGILYPVTLSDPTSLAKNKNYAQWEAAVVKELKDQNLADSLVVANVFVWGIWAPGGKVEKAKGEDKSGPGGPADELPPLASQRGARPLLGINTRIINVKNGNTLFEDDATYVPAGKSEFSAEDLLKNRGKLFERELDCVLEWYAKNLKSQLANEARLEEYKCSDRGH